MFGLYQLFVGTVTFAAGGGTLFGRFGYGLPGALADFGGVPISVAMANFVAVLVGHLLFKEGTGSIPNMNLVKVAMEEALFTGVVALGANLVLTMLGYPNSYLVAGIAAMMSLQTASTYGGWTVGPSTPLRAV